MARGSVEQRGERFRGVYRTGRQKHHGPWSTSRKEADRWLVKQMASVNDGSHVAPKDGRTPIRDLYDLWREAHAGTPRTLKRYESLWNNHLRDTWADVPLNKVSIPSAEKWLRRLERTVSERTGEVLSESTIAGCHAVLYAMLTYAVRKAKLINHHPLLGMEHPRVRPAKVVPPPAADIEALLAELPDKLQPILIMEAGFGLRYGEAAGLTADRLDLTDGKAVANIDRQVHTAEGKGRAYRVADPKMRGADDAGKRLVPVCEWAAVPLRRYLKDHPAVGKGVFVARQPDGNPIPYDTYAYGLNAAQDRLWGEVRYSGHDMRHFYVSQLIAQGIHLSVIQRWIGHVPGSPVTERTYAHLMPGQDDAGRAAMDAAFPQSVPKVSPKRRRTTL